MPSKEQKSKKMKLTKTEIEKLEARGYRYYGFDDSLPGFWLQVTPKGKKAFYFYYRSGTGRSAPWKGIKLGDYPTITPEEARRMAKVHAAAVVLGKDPAQERAGDKKALTIAEAMAEFLTMVAAKRKPHTHAQYATLARNDIIPALGKRKVEDVTDRDIDRFHHSLRAFPVKANRAAAVLSSFFAWCERSGYRAKFTNPVRGLAKNKENERKVFLSDEQMAALGEAVSSLERRGEMSPLVAAALRLLMLTGARKTEILSLKWAYLDLDQGRADLPDSKTGFKTIQLPAAAAAILKDLPRLSEEWVFPAQKKTATAGHMTDVKHAWKRVLKEAGFKEKEWRPHDIRHGVASSMINSGASLAIVGAILGHRKPGTTARYAHVANNPAKAALEKAVEKIAEARRQPEAPPLEVALH